MKKTFLAITILSGIVLGSCSKDKDNNNAPALDGNRYIKAWAASTSVGELNDYSMNFEFVAGGTGTFRYLTTVGSVDMYVTKPANWSLIPGDSIKVEFTCDNFPDYKFEYRGLSNAGGTYAPGIYYRIKKTDAADRVLLGSFGLD
jgi:hypothetical protein